MKNSNLVQQYLYLITSPWHDQYFVYMNTECFVVYAYIPIKCHDGYEIKLCILNSLKYSYILSLSYQYLL